MNNKKQDDDIDILARIWLAFVLCAILIAIVSLIVEELKTVGWIEDWSILLLAPCYRGLF